MELLVPSDIEPNEVTLELISDVIVVANQVNELRPLPADVVKNIEKELLGERVYNSNAIEGNTLTLRETKRILEVGVAVDIGKKREATEARNLGEASGQIQEIIGDRKSWTDETTFLAIHQTLLKDWKDDAAGRIRNERVILTGAKHQPPRPEKLRPLLETFFEHLGGSEKVEPVLLAAWTHWAVARIHPFEDGNGRMARLWQDLVLFGNGLTAAVIRQHERNEYYDALSAADDGELDPLTQLIARSVSRTFQVYVNAQREVDELRGWAQSIVGETKARVDEKRQMEYIRWSREIEQLRDAFERCATQVTNASDGSVEIQVKPFELVDQSTWETLRSGGRGSQTWYFWLNFRQGSKRAHYCFFFGRHMYSEADKSVMSLGPSTCLLVSEQFGNADKPVRLSEAEGCPLSLRELLVVDEKLARIRQDHESGGEVYDLDVDPLVVAREFVQEVFLSRLI